MSNKQKNQVASINQNQPKKAAVIKGVTKQGFRYAISQERLENFELVEVLSEVDTNPMLLPKLIKLLLGDRQAENLKNFLRDEEGFVSTKKIGEVVTEIFNNQDKLKNL